MSINQNFQVVLDFLTIWLNSNWSVALIGGAVGAFGGALGAQYISQRKSRRQDYYKEIKQTNKSIMISAQICNSALGLKKQFALPLAEKFSQTKSDIEYSARKKLVEGDIIYLEMDLVTFPAPVLPLEILATLIYSELSVVGKELSALAEITRAQAGLTDAIKQREIAIEKFSSNETPRDLKTQRYLGHSQLNGQVDTTYADLVEAILDYTNDLAFFSVTLCEELIEHGDRVLKEFRKEFHFHKFPSILRPDFTASRQNGLLVSDEKYGDWTKQFSK
ncbi:MAG: hypothetical protein H3C29_01870 [Simplicispira suum]|uniref:hypothetical protein n=1 Tax=Simplicispira suum TaxID=2109915 RepID=UPI001C6BE6F7|nr:hypothetical protein [Simplicispira suum]MBW7831938.1 hypothetical protein [Simplicispira suum]